MGAGSPVKPEDATTRDIRLLGRIRALETAIEVWARGRDLWWECGFQTFLKRTGREPGEEPAVTVLHFEGPLYQVFNGTYDDGALDEFDALIAAMGFEYALEDHVSLHIYPTDPEEIAAFAEHFRWQWICSLVEPDFADVYEEVYGHFETRPEDLNRLHWREFEILLSGVFRHQGFDVELGPGSGDGGVDLRLLQRDPLGDVLTLVQAKKYAPARKIELQAVQALHGAWAVEKAERACSSRRPNICRARAGSLAAPMACSSLRHPPTWYPGARTRGRASSRTSQRSYRTPWFGSYWLKPGRADWTGSCTRIRVTPSAGMGSAWCSRRRDEPLS